MTVQEWAKAVIEKQPAFDSKEEAIQAAIKANEKLTIHEVWKEPKGDRYIVAAPEAFEALVREEYKRVLDAGELADIERGEADEVDEVD